MYRRILVPLDGSELAECVLPHVEAIGNGCRAQEIILLRVIGPAQWVVGPSYMASELEGGGSLAELDMKQIISETRTEAQSYLAQVKDRIKPETAIIRWDIVTGGAAESIVEYAARNGIDLIAIATHGRSGISRWVWGSVAERVLRSANIPVLMVRVPGCIPLSKEQ